MGHQFSEFDDVLGELLDMEMVESAAWAAGGGLAGGLLYDVATDLLRRDATAEDVGEGKLLPTGSSFQGADGKALRVPVIATPGLRMLTAAGVAVVGGRALWEVNEDAAKGAVGGMVRELGRGLYDMITGKRTVRLTVTKGTDAAKASQAASFIETTQALAGYGLSRALAAAPVAALADAEIVAQMPGGNFADVEVDEGSMVDTFAGVGY